MVISYANMACCMANVRHKEQKDLAGEDYFGHLYRVANRMSRDKEKAVAYLHDILEDYDYTDVTEGDLRKFFPEDIVDAVVDLSRKPNESYFDYISRVKANPLARAVKIADLIDNSNLARLKIVTMKDVQRQKMYNAALEMLMKED